MNVLLLRQQSRALEPVLPSSWRARPTLATVVPIPIVVALFVSTLLLETDLPRLWHVQVILAPLALLTYVLISETERHAITRARVEPALVALIVYVAMSVSWTEAFPHVANKALLSLVASLFVVHIAAGIYEGEALVRRLAIAGMVLATFVLLDAVARPGTAFSADASGAANSLGLRSIYFQKNSLGAAVVLVVALRVAISSKPLRRILALELVILLILCKSGTAILSSIAVVSAQWLIGRITQERRSGRAGSVFLGVGGALIALITAVSLKSRVFELLGKDETVTGRDIIWSSTWDAAQDRLWWGYGVEGFWSPGVGPVGEVRHAVGFQVGSAHQGVIELILEYGVVGAILFFTFLGVLIWRLGSLLMRGDDSAVVRVCAGLIVGILVTSVTESGFIRPGLMTLGLASGLLLTRQRQLVTRDYAPAVSSGAGSAASSDASWRRWKM